MIDEISTKMSTRAAVLIRSIENRIDVILKYWLLVAGLASAARIISAPRSAPVASFSTFASYLLLVIAPVASTLLALRWFAQGHLQPQPTTRLARLGRWRLVDRNEAERHPLYGTNGIMVSLTVGIMLNVPIRAAEYLAAMPPIPAAEPHWLWVLHFALTADAVLFTSLYMIAFVAALRRVPLFPRLLVAIWLGDLLMQVATAQMVSSTHVPLQVAQALHTMLLGNVKKVLISIGLWLPYLLLSERVNVTYRHRISA